MSGLKVPLVIDARPRGPEGPMAVARILGRPLLDHLIDLADSLANDGPEGPIIVHARPEDHARLRGLLDAQRAGRIEFALGPPSERATILRADRLYDPRRLRRAVRWGRGAESAVIWRLDRPQGLAGAESELVRRLSYQPLGRFWSLAPARLIARMLRQTRVRPNAVTLAAATMMLLAASVIGLAPSGLAFRLGTAGLLAMALVLDTADGHLARLQGTASDFGRWLDALLDELCDMVLHAAVAWSAFTRDSAPVWLVAGMVYGMGKYVFFVGDTTWTSRETTTERPAIPTRSTTSMTWSPRDLVRLAGHADIRWHLWIVLAVLGRLDAALVAYALYYPARTVAGALSKRGVLHG